MAKIICLANSRKHGKRCIAGIELDTGEWIRPVSKHGAVPWAVRTVQGKEPELLDILEIPLEESGIDSGFQPENRLVAKGDWKKVGRVKPVDILKYCSDEPLILHNDIDRVSQITLQNLPKREWKSLQLVRCCWARFHRRATPFKSKPQCRAEFPYGSATYNLVVTDTTIEEKVEKRSFTYRDCLLTISLGGPYDDDYYKYMAGAVELPDA